MQAFVRKEASFISKEAKRKSNEKESIQRASIELSSLPLTSVQTLISKSSREEDIYEPTTTTKVETAFLVPYLEEENKLEDNHITAQYFQIITVDELISTLFCFLSISCGIAYHEVRNCKEACQEYEDRKERIVFLSLISCSIGVIGYIIMLIPKYFHYYRFYRAAKYISIYENFFHTELPFKALLELVLALIHPNYYLKDYQFTTNPSWNLWKITYHINDILLVIHISRVFYFIKFAVIYSEFYTPSADRICKLMGAKLSLFFSFKSLLITYTFSTLILCTLIICSCLAYMLKIIEGPLHSLIDLEEYDINDYSKFTNCFWNVLVTMTTVGYGDYFPRSFLGRLIGIITALAGTVVVALIVSFFQGQTSLDEAENTTYNFIKRIRDKDRLKESAASYFKWNYKYILTKRKFEDGLISNNIFNKKYLIYLAKTRFLARQGFKQCLHEFQVQYNMENDFDKVKKRIDILDTILTTMNNKIKKLNNNLKSLIMHLITSEEPENKAKNVRKRLSCIILGNKE